jgi:hypothetical protein
MSIRVSRWLLLPAQTVLAVTVALAVASVSSPTVSAQDQELAIPACGEVFGIGELTEACLRVVNASTQDVGPVDVYVGEAIVVEELEYGQATEFTAIPSDAQQLRVVPAGTAVGEATVDFTEELTPGGAYQLTVSGLAREELSSWISGVDVSPTATDQARARVVHASPDLGAVDVAVAQGDVPFQGIEVGTQSGYVPFEAGDFIFQVRQTEEDTLLLATPEPVQLEEGMIYDLYVIGQSEAGTLELVVYASEVGVAGNATPAGELTPVVAVGGTPIPVTPGAETPAPTPDE